MTIPQAHVKCPIAHADTSGFETGAVVGIVLGGVFVIFTVASGGTLTLVGAVSMVSSGASAGTVIGESVIDPNVAKVIEGSISDGPPDTFIGESRQKAARASMGDPKTLVDCDPGSYVIQGSETVFINRCSASRRGEGTSCGGYITDGDPTVFTGGATATLFGVGPAKDANLVAMENAKLVLDLIGLIAAPETRLGKWVYGMQATATGLQVADVASASEPLKDAGKIGGAVDLAGELATKGLSVDRAFNVGTTVIELLGIF